MILWTERLELVPMTLPMVEAVMRGDRHAAEAAAQAKFPAAWPGAALVERAFTATLSAIIADPERRLWGDRLMISRAGPRQVVGSVIFHGQPGDDGIAEVGYGVEESSQGLGLATEATRACLAWAFAQPGVRLIRATTLPWHSASLRVIAKLGMRQAGGWVHELLGEMVQYETSSVEWMRQPAEDNSEKIQL